MSSRAPNAPPTPPRVRRTLSTGRPRQAASCLRSSWSHWVAMKSSTPDPPGSGSANAASRPRKAWSCMPIVVGALHHHVAGGLRVAVDDPLVAVEVAVGMDRCVAAGDGHLRIGERLEHLVGDDDGLEGAAAGLRVVRGHRGHGLADVADDVGGEHRLVLADEPVGGLAGHVSRGDDGFDAGDGPRTREVDRPRSGRTGGESAAWPPRASRRPRRRRRTRSALAPSAPRRAAPALSPEPPPAAAAPGEGVESAHGTTVFEPRPAGLRCARTTT